MGCGDGLVSDKYCRLPARFTFTPVNSIQQLYTACNSMGEWCAITLNNNQLYFTTPSGTGQANLTASSSYQSPIMGLSGFIVGLPNIPEAGTDYPVVTCYELACRNCYEEQSITPRLQLQTSGYAHCTRCQRTYNLNNTGIVSQGTAGKALYRYRVYYSENTLAVNNN